MGKAIVGRVPGSKSMTQRALVMAALADRPVHLAGALRCDDSARLSELLVDLGATVEWRGDAVTVVAPAEFRPSGKSVWCGNAGTTVRFGICLSLLLPGELVLDGDARMRERPIGSLGAALGALGCRVRYLGREGCPPIGVERGASLPSMVEVDASLSSQFASGLALVAPRLPQGLEIRLAPDAVSLSYLAMTVRMMERAGIALSWNGSDSLRVRPGRYFADAGAAPVIIAVEPDWSGAAFLFAAGFATGLPVEIPGLKVPGESLQGDAVFGSFLQMLATDSAHDIDLSDCPDLIAPLVAAALFASRPTRIRGAAHTRVKESDRIAVLCREFRKIGARFEEYPDGMLIHPLDAPVSGEQILDPAGDHRMAMTFGVVSLRVPQIRVADPGCVSKSFPDFWSELERFGAHRARVELVLR
jgi:3-phosphoshikimate 1-carboxyvinyltransferase